MTAAGQETPAAFGERFAHSWALGMAGLGLFVAVTVVGQGLAFPLVGAAGVLALSRFFRRRALYDAQRGRRALEDERDRALLAHGDAVFRFAASAWMVGLALALAVPPLRDVLSGAPLRLPGLLLLGAIVANVAGHAAVARRYRRERR